MFKDPRAGLMHAGIFWGFILLTIGTANVVTGGIIEQVASIPFDGLVWALISAMQNIVAVIVLGSIGWAFYRRLVTKPARLTLNRDALVILSMIGGVVGTELLAEVFEFARFGDQPGAFVSAVVAGPLRSFVEPGALEVAFVGLWWAHIALVAAFLAYLPFSKHLHIATSFPNIWYRKLAPRGELPALDIEDEHATFGLKTLQDLGWKDLLDGFTCTECGRCQEACPAWNTGKPLNPKTFIMGIRDMSVDAEHGIDIIPNSPIVREVYGLDDTSPSAERSLRRSSTTAIPYDAVWDCVTCGACVEACPVLIEHVDKIVGLRRNLVLEESRFPPELTGAFRAMEGQGNPWGQPASTRDGLDEARCRSRCRTVASVASAGRAGRTRGPVLGRLRGGVRRAQSEGRTSRWRPACTRRTSRSRSWARRSRARATRPGGWATTTSSRSSRPANDRDARTATGWGAHDRHGLPALLQHDRQ
ncbi:MAG: (Fe-S)-binding protein [Candidatus Limnocylindrales bacterium]